MVRIAVFVQYSKIKSTADIRRAYLPTCIFHSSTKEQICKRFLLDHNQLTNQRELSGTLDVKGLRTQLESIAEASSLVS